jgi:hypothetical protein
MSPKAAPTRAKKSAKTGAKSKKPVARAKKSARSMSTEHKAALAVGRTEGRSVRVYLEALESNRPKRGRKRTSESVSKRLAAVDKQLAGADPLRRLQLVQEQMDLRAELEAMNHKVDMRALEDDFVKAAKGYSQRKGITYAAWRQIGVTPAVLKRAGIARSS